MRRSGVGAPSWAALMGVQFILLTAVSGVSAGRAADGVCRNTYSCPKDAYCPKDGIAGVDRKLHPEVPCPANTVTRGLGSSLLSECKCKSGFAGPEGVRAPYAPSHVTHTLCHTSGTLRSPHTALASEFPSLSVSRTNRGRALSARGVKSASGQTRHFCFASREPSWRLGCRTNSRAARRARKVRHIMPCLPLAR